MSTMEADAVLTGSNPASRAGARVEATTTGKGAQLPLAMVSEGETIRVLKVRGGATLRQHLSEMGFVEGAEVKVVSRVNGDVVVSVKGSTFGIGRDMSMRIVTY